MEKMEKAHAAERHGLKEKLERLQRANKQRRGEIEEMQTKLSSMHQRASAYDQVQYSTRGSLEFFWCCRICCKACAESMAVHKTPN